jgi:hypothetical protein
LGVTDGLIHETLTGQTSMNLSGWLYRFASLSASPRIRSAWATAAMEPSTSPSSARASLRSVSAAGWRQEGSGGGQGGRGTG